MKKFLFSAFSLIAISASVSVSNVQAITTNNLNNATKNESAIMLDDFMIELSTYDWEANNYIYSLQNDVDFSSFIDSPASYNFVVNPTNTLTFLGNGHKFFGKDIYKGAFNSSHDVFKFDNTYLDKNYLFTSIANVNFSNLMFDDFPFFAKDAINVNFEDIAFRNIDVSHLSMDNSQLNIGLFIQNLTNGIFKNLVIDNISSNAHYIENSKDSTKKVNLAFINKITDGFSLDSFYINDVSYDYWKVSDNNHDVSRGINIGVFSNDLTAVSDLNINDGFLNNLQFLNNTPFATFSQKQYSIFANDFTSWNSDFKMGNIMIGNEIETDKKTTENNFDLNFINTDFSSIDITQINPNGSKTPKIILEEFPLSDVDLFPSNDQLITRTKTSQFLKSDFQSEILTSKMFYLENQQLPTVPIANPVFTVKIADNNKSFLKVKKDITVDINGILFEHNDISLTLKANEKKDVWQRSFAFPEATNSITVSNISLWKHKNYSVEITIGDSIPTITQISTSDWAPLIILISMIILLILFVIILLILLSIRRKLIERKNTQTEIAILEDIINEYGIVLHENETNDAYEADSYEDYYEEDYLANESHAPESSEDMYLEEVYSEEDYLEDVYT